jgi:hypothetical protein
VTEAPRAPVEGFRAAERLLWFVLVLGVVTATVVHAVWVLPVFVPGAIVLWLALALSVVVLVILLGSMLAAARRGGHTPFERRMAWRTAIGLVLGWGGCLGMVVSVAFRLAVGHVEVHNVGAVPVEHVRVHGVGVDLDFGDLPAGRRERRRFWVQHDGELAFEAMCAGTPCRTVVEGYVTRGVGGDWLVEVDADGVVRVLPRSQW